MTPLTELAARLHNQICFDPAGTVQDLNADQRLPFASVEFEGAAICVSKPACSVVQ